MTDSFSLGVDGRDRLMLAFNDLKEKTGNQILRQLQTSADRVLAASQREVAVDKGDLKGSGHVEPGVEGDRENFSFAVVYGDGEATSTTYTYPDGPADGYSWFVELGTQFMDAQPYLGPAFEEESQKLVTRLGNILEK